MTAKCCQWSWPTRRFLAGCGIPTRKPIRGGKCSASTPTSPSLTLAAWRFAAFLARMEEALPDYRRVLREIRTERPALIVLGLVARLGDDKFGSRCAAAVELLREHGLHEENLMKLRKNPQLSPPMTQEERYEQDKIRMSVQNVLKERTRKVFLGK